MMVMLLIGIMCIYKETSSIKKFTMPYFLLMSIVLIKKKCIFKRYLLPIIDGQKDISLIVQFKTYSMYERSI